MNDFERKVYRIIFNMTHFGKNPSLDQLKRKTGKDDEQAIREAVKNLMRHHKLKWNKKEQKKKNDLKAALELYQEGQKVAARHNNQKVTEKLKLVKGLYLSFDLQTLREVFKFFEEKNLYGDMEEYAVADFLTNKEDRYDAVDFYQMAIEARKQIQRGKHLNEKM
nr:hypothetical protein [Bacillus atrophaeus]